MKNQVAILLQHLSEQISLEEQLCSNITAQLLETASTDSTEAKDLLISISKALELNFKPLNELFDKLEEKTLRAANSLVSNGDSANGTEKPEPVGTQISKMLSVDYSALNLITIGNTLLHTTALAFDSKEVAAISLKHLEKMTPLVLKINELMPGTVVRELQVDFPKIELEVAVTALNNSQRAWQKLANN